MLYQFLNQYFSHEVSNTLGMIIIFGGMVALFVLLAWLRKDDSLDARDRATIATDDWVVRDDNWDDTQRWG